MGASTSISWCDHTWNPWWGCTKVPGDPACEFCYAEAFAHRLGLKIWGKTKPRKFQSESYWEEPIKWNAKATKAGLRRRVFCASMSDVFEDRPDLIEDRLDLWRLIESTKNLDWLLLTKRPQNIRLMLELNCYSRTKNVWLGTTAVTQRHYDERLPKLLDNPAAVHFVSCEPLVEPIDLCLGMYTKDGPRPEWVIVGGESGPRARPFDLEWARSIRDQCRRAGVAFFLKQLGSHGRKDKGDDMAQWPEDLRIQEFPLPR